MQRRIALSLSLAITTIVMFAMVTVGAQAGFFSEHKTAKASQDADPAEWAAPPADAPPAPVEEDPLVVTDYVYVDEAGAPVIVSRPRVASQPAAPKAASTNKAQSQPTAAGQPSAGQPTTATKPATVVPTQAAPGLPATEPPAATATHPPAATSTPKPAATATTAPAQPTAPPTNQPHEIEFVGTVTAINGDMVTFSHNGTSTIVRVTQHYSIGARVHVHAILSGGVYVAVEAEEDD